MVPTDNHREASALAPYVNLARGWNRQADAARNRLFYRDRPLTAKAYQHWLRRWAVHFVVLTKAKPDGAAVKEAALVAGGLPYLERVWSDEDWVLYEVLDPRPLVSEPAQVLGFDAAQITVYTPQAGPVEVRIAYSEWLGLLDALGKPVPTAQAGPDGGRCRSPASPAAPHPATSSSRATTGWCCTPRTRGSTASGRRTRCRAAQPAPDGFPPPWTERSPVRLGGVSLLDLPTDELTRRAREVRARANGTRVTYSPKVFIPLTRLCRDRCGYCTFATAPRHLPAPYLTPDEVLAIARAGCRGRLPRGAVHARRGARGPLPEARDWLDEHGYASTVDYLAAMAGWCWRRPGCCRTPTPARCSRASSRGCAPSRRPRG